jgi:hypothetical protein
MIGWQKIYAIIAGLIYLVLFIVFIFYSKSDIVWSCNELTPCLRFCSNDTEKFPIHELFSKFGNFGISNFYNHGFKVDENATDEELKYHSYWGSYYTSEITFTIFRGEPNCDFNVIENPEHPEYYFETVN